MNPARVVSDDHPALHRHQPSARAPCASTSEYWEPSHRCSYVEFVYAESERNLLDCETSRHRDVYGSPMADVM
jgi:hypothetical protein